MRPIVGNTSSEGKKPTTPTIGAASAGNATTTVSFTESTYRGKNNAGTYRATSSPSSITGTCVAPCNSISINGLSNGTAYTFTVRLETPYGVNSDESTSSNSVTPVAPPFFPPDFPPFFPGPFFPPCFNPQPAQWSNCSSPNSFSQSGQVLLACGEAGVPCPPGCTGLYFIIHYNSCGQAIGYCYTGSALCG